MAHMDIFNDNAFNLVTLSALVDAQPHIPTFLGSLGLFTPRPARTQDVSFDRRHGKASIVPTSPRGAPLHPRTADVRDLVKLTAPRIATTDTITASELAGLRAFGTESELAVVQDEVMYRLNALRSDIELTWENMRLGAVQGIVKDANGETLYSLYDKFGVTQPEELDFDLDNGSPASGAVRKKCAEVVRAAKRAAGNGWIEGRTYLMGLADDTFWDQLIAHAEVRGTYLNQAEARDLRLGSDFGQLTYGGITFVNYRGTDDNSTVKVPAGKCKFFPANAAPDLYQAVLTPGEFFESIDRPGQALYALTIPDRDRNAWVQLEMYSYPLFVCTRPTCLQRARNT